MKKLNRRQFLRRSLLTATGLFVPHPKYQTELVEFVWSGAVTATSATVKAKLRVESNAVRLVVSQNGDLSQPLFSAFRRAAQADNNRVVSLLISGLQPSRQYYYAIEIDGTVDLTRWGKFRTFPSGPASFSFAFASCAETGSNHPIFETIRRRNPLFFLHTGDMHYLDIAANDRNLFRRAYETVLASPGQASLYRDVPLVYMWDDHDFGPNDSDALASGREASRLTYQEMVPHYPLVAGSGNVPIYQAFTVGRVRFLLTDTRSERSPKSAPDDANKSILGAGQKAWLKEELLRAKSLYSLVVWVSPAAWIPDLSDGWTLYSTERRELADFIKENEIKNLVMLTGDLHMLGIDNGSHSGFASGGGDGFPVMQASPLDQFAFEEGIPFAPYSEGVVAQRGVFGLMLVFDTGGATLTIRWSGRNSLNEEMLGYTFTI